MQFCQLLLIKPFKLRSTFYCPPLDWLFQLRRELFWAIPFKMNHRRTGVLFRAQKLIYIIPSGFALRS
jgi:hypothetical protein